MKGYPYQIGDRVVLSVGFNNWCYPGDKGTIVAYPGMDDCPLDMYGISLDTGITGHDCRGYAEPKHGIFLMDRNFELENTAVLEEITGAEESDLMDFLSA
jgi:hypothetical protein